MLSFEQYVRSRLPRLMQIAQVICGEQQLGEDLVQDVLIKLQPRWDRVVVDGADPDPYVRRMLINEFLSWRRKWARLIPHADVGLDLVDDGRDHAGHHAERDALVREVARLPGRQRVAVTLRYLAGLPDEDIAQAMNCSPATVRVQVHRALRFLRITTDSAVHDYIIGDRS